MSSSYYIHVTPVHTPYHLVFSAPVLVRSGYVPDNEPFLPSLSSRKKCTQIAICEGWQVVVQPCHPSERYPHELDPIPRESIPPSDNGSHQTSLTGFELEHLDRR